MVARLKTIEQRAETRIPIRILVEYERLDDFLADYTANVSLGGMFIQTPSPLDVGTRFRLRLRIPGRARPVETYGEVRWRVRTDDGPTAGMGIAFDVLMPGDLRAVEHWLRDWDGGGVSAG